jgi:AraC-like DNA-binding protein
MDSLQFWQHPPRLHLCVVMPRASRRRLKYAEHTHPFHELAMLLDGECEWRLGTKRERLRAGDLLLVPAGVRHYEHTLVRGRARIGWIGFDFTDGHADIPAALRAPLSAGEHTEELRRLFDVVCSEHQGNALGHRERAGLALREVLILLARLKPAGAEPPALRAPKARRTAQLVQSAAFTLTGNLSQPMRIRDLANYHALSASHFARLFREREGVTPQRYLQNARLARAKSLLAEGELTIKEIAAACGYVDAAHFCHAFKTATKLTPKAFRKKTGG